MAYFYSLLLITILTVTSGATPLNCSDVQSTASGSGNTDLSQVTTLQYCIIDNCTIMSIDTEQQLDIVYTTESLLIVTSKDNHTSVVITKVDDELLCLEYQNTTNGSEHTTDDSEHTIYEIINIVIIITVSACIVIIHLLFRDLRTSLFGKLLMFYNFALVTSRCTFLSLQLMHYWITVNSQTICHIATIMFVSSFPCVESFATNILTHSACLMYRCYHLRSEISKKRSNCLLRCYTAYAANTLALVFFVTIAYDWMTGNGKYTISASVHCYIADHPITL